MRYEPLKGTENAGLARKIINDNFNNIYEYLNRDSTKGLLCRIEYDEQDSSWTYDQDEKCYICTIDFDFKDSNFYSFFVYSYSDSIEDVELVHFDIKRNFGESKITLYSDMPFKGWVSYA